MKSLVTVIESKIVEIDHDLELVQKSREGCRAAFEALFERHKPFVYNVCYRILGSSEDAVDATQAAFIKAYREIRKFRGDSAFRSWLYRLAVNECTALLRREARRRILSLNQEEPAEVPVQKDNVWEAILELPVDMRVVLVLFYFQELSCDEIAETLGCAPGAVRTRLHRARAAFKMKYEEIGNEV